MKKVFEVTYETDDPDIMSVVTGPSINSYLEHDWDYSPDVDIRVRLIQEDSQRKATVSLFKDSGKWYCDEDWIIPEKAIGPWDMADSPDFRRIGNGKVLVHEQEPFGFPVLL